MARKLWILTTILLVGFIAVQCIFLLKPGINLGMKQMSFAIDIFSNLIFFLILGAIVGLLVGFIPFKQKAFKEKVKETIPLSTSLIMLLYFTNFGYVLYQVKIKGIELLPVIKYDDIKIPENIDCISVHNGRFEDDKYIIERTHNKQIQINKKSGEKEEFNVSWSNDCEYVLTPLSDSLDKIRVKIISVNPSNYGCYVNAVKKRKEAFFVREKRIK